jgi:exonuclease SbcC
VRPLKLEIEGFTAFRQPVCLDLGELDLFAITGPTGAGKSSLIDAICYALYGRVPRVTNEVASCISQGMDRMRVALEFMAGEERYRIFRETRRKGAPNVRLDRWREDDWQALVDRAHDVTARVIEIVGLDYDGFTRSVLLPQGQFQEFLAGSADKRRAVLRSLLRLEVYDRMRARAGGVAAELKTRLDERERELAGLADATPENAKRLEAELAAKQAESQRLAGEIKALEVGVTLAVALNQARQALAQREAEARDALAEFEKTKCLVDQGDGELATLQVKLESLEQQLAANCFDAERLTALSVARERVKELSQTQSAVEQATRLHNDATQTLAQATAAAETAAKRCDLAEAALYEAAAALDEAKRHNLAAALQNGLKPGDPCPVCGGKVGVLTVFESASLGEAEERYEKARKTEAEARAALQTANNAATRAAERSEGSERRLVELDAQRLRQEQALAEALPDEKEATPAAIEAALGEQMQARALRQALEADLKQASAQAQALRVQLEAARQHLAALEQRAGIAAQALDAAQATLATARGELETLARRSWQEIVASLDGDVAVVLRRRVETAQNEERAAVQAIGQMQERLARLEKDIDKARELRRELEKLKKEHGVAADLSQMLMANRFQAFIQQEALSTLAADGSRRLEALSAGRYRLQVDEKGQDFEVIDQWNADQARSVKTLSGGETFLASLSLSLALAESLPGLAASRRVVLDSIFLDEGFGSLDAEALDRAADALDALRTENRMVCVVTHLQELAQRLPARVVVTKAESGSTVAVA